MFSSFASRALIVQFEQLTHILLCITLSKLTLWIWICDYTTTKNKNDPKPWRINPKKKMKIPFFFPDRWRFLVVLKKKKNTWCSSGMHWWLSIRTEKISPNESHQSLHEQYVGFQVEKKKKLPDLPPIDTITPHHSPVEEKNTHTLTLLVRVHYYSRGDDAVHYAFKLYDVDVYNVWKIPLCFRRYCKI